MLCYPPSTKPLNLRVPVPKFQACRVCVSTELPPMSSGVPR